MKKPIVQFQLLMVSSIEAMDAEKSELLKGCFSIKFKTRTDGGHEVTREWVFLPFNLADVDVKIGRLLPKAEILVGWHESYTAMADLRIGKVYFFKNQYVNRWNFCQMQAISDHWYEKCHRWMRYRCREIRRMLQVVEECYAADPFNMSFINEEPIKNERCWGICGICNCENYLRYSISFHQNLCSDCWHDWIERS